MTQVFTNVIAIILFSSIHCIVNKLSQKKSFGIKNEEIIWLFLFSLEEAIFFVNIFNIIYIQNT